MFLKTAHHSTIFFIFLVISIFSLFFLLFSPIKAEQVTRLIPAPGFTPITSSSPPINTASFPAPSVNPGEKVIGVYAFIHDGGTSWSFTPTVRFQDGSEGNLIVGCKANTDQGKYGDGVYDVCTGSGDPTIKHYLTLTGTETRQIESVRFFFDNGTPNGGEILNFERLEWLIAADNSVPVPSATPVPTPIPSITPSQPPNLCVIKETKYVADNSFTEIRITKEGSKYSFNAPSVGVAQRVIGVNVIMNDFGAGWIYKPVITLNDGTQVFKPGISNPCLIFDHNVPSDKRAQWIDVCTKYKHPITGRIDSHELKLNNSDQQVQNILLEFDSPSGNGEVKFYGLEWIIADCGGSTTGECEVVSSVINSAGALADGQRRLSAVEKQTLSWTKPEIKNTECSYVNTEIYFTERSSDGACNYPANPIATYTDINQTNLDINDFEKYKSYLLNWNKNYCWKVKNNVQKLKTLEIVSNSQTKIRSHNVENVAQIPYWMKYDGVLDSSSDWKNANTVYDNSWSICTVASQPWRPSGADPNVPSNCYNVNTRIFMNPNGDENLFPRIIQLNSDVNRGYGDRDAFRRKFDIPVNAVVGKGTLYSASDSVASYWINENAVNNTTGSLINNNVCGQSTTAGSYRGIHKIDVPTSFLKTGANILSGSVINADECNKVSAMGIQYILKVEYADLTDNSTKTGVESQSYTFSTNKTPVFIRNGFTMDSDFKKDTGINTEIPLGTLKCGFNTGCSIYPSATAPICFSGNSQSGKADNPVTFWFEYNDPDNDSSINENFKHYMVLTKATDKIDNLTNLSDFAGGILHSAQRDIIIEYDLANIAVRGQQADKVRVNFYGKYEDPATKAIRVYYTLEFLEGFETNMYNIFAMFETLAQGNSSTAILSDNMAWAKLNLSPQFWTDSRLFTSRGAWGVDLEVPTVDNPEINISGVNEFGVKWSVQESGEIGDVTLACYTKDTSIALNYIAPDTAFGINVNGKIDNPTQCVSNNDKVSFINFLNDKNPANNTYVTRYLINEYKKFGDLGTIISATDRACNISEPKTQETAPVQDNWISTRQGTLFSQDGPQQDRELSELAEPTKDKTYFTYDFSNNIKYLYDKGTNDITNLSTNFLGIETGSLKANTSLTREEITGFKDFNEVPLITDLPTSVDTWYKYFEYIQEQKGKKVVSKGSATVNDISQLSCGVNEACVYGPLKLSATNGKNLCDTSKVVFVKGTLTIEDELLNKDDKSACIFVVEGNIEIANNQPKKDKESTALSPYDVIEGYFITNGKVTIKADQDLGGLQRGLGDGIFVRGGIVAADFENGRNLGIRNTIQPPALMVYDPRYLYILRDEITARFIQVRETGFNPET